MVRARLLTALLVFCATGLLGEPAPAAADAISECAGRLVRYKDHWLGGGATKVELDHSSGGRLAYLGLRHTANPADSQFGALEAAFESLMPTVVFHEGHETRVASSARESIEEYGESGYVRWLARTAGVAARTLEPSATSEISTVLTEFSREKVQLHYLLRDVMLFRERRGAGEQEIREELARMLESESALPRVLVTVDQFESAFRRYWAYPRAWWNPSKDWFNPLYSSSRTGGVFTNDIERVGAQFRDRTMYERLARAVRQGERVFAAVGRGHIPMQAAALRCVAER